MLHLAFWQATGKSKNTKRIGFDYFSVKQIFIIECIVDFNFVCAHTNSHPFDVHSIFTFDCTPLYLQALLNADFYVSVKHTVAQKD